eukprot:scaffold131316_cov69-Phaeocystis_antarctica.AAC.1
MGLPSTLSTSRSRCRHGIAFRASASTSGATTEGACSMRAPSSASRCPSFHGFGTRVYETGSARRLAHERGALAKEWLQKRRIARIVAGALRVRRPPRPCQNDASKGRAEEATMWVTQLFSFLARSMQTGVIAGSKCMEHAGSEPAWDTTLQQIAALLELQMGDQARGVPMHVLARDVLSEMLRLDDQPHSVMMPVIDGAGVPQTLVAESRPSLPPPTIPPPVTTDGTVQAWQEIRKGHERWLQGLSSPQQAACPPCPPAAVTQRQLLTPQPERHEPHQLSPPPLPIQPQLQEPRPRHSMAECPPPPPVPQLLPPLPPLPPVPTALPLPSPPLPPQSLPPPPSLPTSLPPPPPLPPPTPPPTSPPHRHPQPVSTPLALSSPQSWPELLPTVPPSCCVHPDTTAAATTDAALARAAPQ